MLDANTGRLLREQSLIRKVDYRQWDPAKSQYIVRAVVDGGTDIATGVAAPRWAAEMEQHLGAPSLTVVESRYHASVISGLRERGHDVQVAEPWSSGMGHEHAIEIVRDASSGDVTLAATADPRSEGLPQAW